MYSCILINGGSKDNIKLKSDFREDEGIPWNAIFLVVLAGGHVDVESVAEFDEPAFGSFEGICFAQLNCKFSNLLLVS